jgi:hypothetical protein
MHEPEIHSYPLISEQVLPQLPQLLTSLSTSMHEPLQKACPAGQAQVPLWQIWPPVHWMPQGSGGAWPSELSPQQAMVPSLLSPQECSAPALTEVKLPAGGVAWPR